MVTSHLLALSLSKLSQRKRKRLRNQRKLNQLLRRKSQRKKKSKRRNLRRKRSRKKNLRRKKLRNLHHHPLLTHFNSLLVCLTLQWWTNLWQSTSVKRPKESPLWLLCVLNSRPETPWEWCWAELMKFLSSSKNAKRVSRNTWNPRTTERNLSRETPIWLNQTLELPIQWRTRSTRDLTQSCVVRNK